LNDLEIFKIKFEWTIHILHIHYIYYIRGCLFQFYARGFETCFASFFLLLFFSSDVCLLLLPWCAWVSVFITHDFLTCRFPTSYLFCLFHLSITNIIIINDIVNIINVIINILILIFFLIIIILILTIIIIVILKAFIVRIITLKMVNQ